MSRYVLLLIALVCWLVPLPVKASTEKQTPLVFYTTQEQMKGTAYVYGPSLSEVPSVETKPKAQTKTKRTQEVQHNSTTTRRRNTAFARGQCTDYVAQKTTVTWRGNASKWIPNARSQGYVVDKNPTVGGILVTGESRYGHVTYIEKVEGTKVTISEWNFAGKYKLTIRTLDISNPVIRGIIHT